MEKNEYITIYQNWKIIKQRLELYWESKIAYIQVWNVLKFFLKEYFSIKQNDFDEKSILVLLP